MSKKPETPIEKVIRLAEGAPALADVLGVSHQFVYKCLARGWFPPKRAKQLEQLYGVPRKGLMNPEIVALLG